MPIYEYKGQEYELSTTDPAEAKVKILNYLGQQTAPAPAPAAPAAPIEPVPAVSQPIGEGLGQEIMAQAGAPTPTSRSVLQGVKLPEPASAKDKLLNPDFVDAMKRRLGSMQPEQRAAELDRLLRRPDVYGRAAKVVAAEYAELDKAAQRGAPSVISRVLPGADSRMEAIERSLIEQGLDPEAAKGEAQVRAAFYGGEGPKLQTIAPDVVGEEGLKRAAAKGEELKDAGFWTRVGEEMRGQAGQVGLGITAIAADLVGDEKLQNSVRDSLRIAGDVTKAIPKGDTIFERSAQQAMTSLATQAPFMLLGAVTGTAAPVLAPMALQVFGKEYGEGRLAKLSPFEATLRAGLLATSEVIFERFGLTESLKAIRGAVNRIPTNELSGYLAKALAKEIPGEQLTQATNFLIDKAPGIGLNPNAGWKDFLEGQAEAFRQTLLMSGTVAGATMGTAKGIQAADKLLRREPGYQRDTSYEGLSELLARSKGFLEPTEAPTPPPPAAEPEPLERKGVRPTIKPEEREARIQEIAAAHVGAGIDPNDAVAMARNQIEREYGKAAEKVPTIKAPEGRVELLTQEFIDAGEDPANARVLAERKVQEETQADALAEAAEKGAKSVAGPVEPADRAGAAVAGQPRVEPTAAGAGAPKPSGVAPAEPPTAVSAAGERIEPTSVEDQLTALIAEQNKLRTKNGRRPAAKSPAGQRFDAIGQQIAAVKAQAAELATQAEAGRVEPTLEGELPQAPVTPEPALTGEQVGTQAPQAIEAATQGPAEPAAQPAAPAVEAAKPAEVAETAETITPAEDAEATAAAESTVGALADQLPKVQAKRGRKAVALTEEEKARKDTALREYKRKYAQGSRELQRIQTQLDTATAPLDESTFPDEEALKAAQGERRSNLLQAVRSLLSLERNHRGTPLGNKAKALLADRSKISQQQYDDIKKGFELTQPSKSLTSSRVKPNLLIKGGMSAAQVLTAIGKGGTPFERMMANRLRKFLTGVRIYVVEDGDPVPPRIQQAANAEAWDRARGVYLAADETGPREVYLRGASFGYQNGINNVTALHELLHAAINYRIGLGLVGSLRGQDSVALVRFVQELSGLMMDAGDRYLQLERAGLLPARLRDLVEATAVEDPDTGETDFEIFTLPQEFLAYGLTDPVFQQYLMAIDGQRTEESGFSRFVKSILKLLGLAPKEFTALSDLINITDDIFGARTAELIMPAGKSRAFMASKIKLTPEQIAAAKEQKKIDAAVAEANAKYDTSRLGEEYAQGVSALQMLQKPSTIAPVIRGLWDGATYKTRKGILKPLSLDFITAVWGEKIPEIKNTAILTQEMNGLMMKLLKASGELTTEIHRAYRKDPKLREKLNHITRVATLAEVDPADPTATKRNEDLDTQYAQLGPEGQRIYKRIRDHYASLSEYFTHLLNEQITRSGLSLAEQNNLLKKIRSMYEAGSKITPYFPLVRRGDFWFSMGAGKNRVFMMFESIAERDRAIDGFLDERIKRLSGESDAAFAQRRQETLGELFDDKTWDKGNDIKLLREKTTQSSQLLTGMFSAVDASNFLDPEAKERLKDDIYQLYLQTMPEQSFRRQFIHRKGLAGFRTDLLRDVADTTSKMAVQLSRIKYAPQLRSSISQAKDYIADTPELTPVVQRVEDMTNATLNPGKQGVAMAISNGLNRLGFIFYLGGASSALIQPISMLTMGLPVLSRYGTVNANREFSRAMQLWKVLGVRKVNQDGTESWVAPSLEFAKGLSADEHRAITDLQRLDVLSSTFAGAVFDYKNKPSAKLSGPKVQLAKDFVNVAVLGGLMHSTERLTREMMSLMSYRLNRQAGKTHEEAVRQAAVDVNEALFNYASYNRPLFMRTAPGNVLTQFMMFPVQLTLFLLRNFIEIIRPLDGRTRWEAAKKFFGALGSVLVLGGVAALPWALTASMGFIAEAWRALSGEDDRPKEVRDMDFFFWWRTQWLDEMLGETRIGGVRLSDIVDRGVLNAITGVDISSRITMNNLFFREGKEQKDVHSAMADFALEKAGPSANAIVSILEGLEAGSRGDYGKMVKKVAPAGFRNFASAYELYKEGAKDNKGTEILSRDAFTTGSLLFQAVGFRSDLLANTQYVNFKVIGLNQKIENKRNLLLDQIDRAYREGDGDAYGKYMDELAKFNLEYPTYKVTTETLRKSILGKAERRAKSYRGVDISKKNVPIFGETMRPSRLAAEEKERQ